MGTKFSTHINVMSYLVKKKVGKYEYWQEIESYRDKETGKIKKRVLKHHGKKKPKQTTLQTMHSSASNEWYTPEKYIIAARDLMGSIDLDPASNEVAQIWIKAKKYLTVTDNGFKQSWLGNVWLNPPYGAKNLKSDPPVYGASSWIKKAISEYQTGQIKQAVLLVRASGNSGIRALEVYPRCLVGRIDFCDQNGNIQKGVGHDLSLIHI